MVQAPRVAEAEKHVSSPDTNTRRLAVGRLHTECNYFAIAANKLLEFKKWALSFGLCTNVDFREIDAFSQRDIRDLRNMREHVVDYFKGDGSLRTAGPLKRPSTARTQAPTVDLSSVEGLIGPRSERPLGGSCRNF